MYITEQTPSRSVAGATGPGPATGLVTGRGEDRLLELDGVVDAARRLTTPQRDRGPRPSTPRLGPQRSEAREVLRRVSLWPYVRVDLQRDGAALHSGVRDNLIARLDLVTGALTAFVIADMARSLVSTQPLLRLTCDGVQVHVLDEDSRKAGERLIRWRIDLERFGAQLREASP